MKRETRYRMLIPASFGYVQWRNPEPGSIITNKHFPLSLLTYSVESLWDQYNSSGTESIRLILNNYVCHTLQNLSSSSLCSSTWSFQESCCYSKHKLCAGQSYPSGSAMLVSTYRSASEYMLTFARWLRRSRTIYLWPDYGAPLHEAPPDICKRL
jgi:hypothetical protein